VAGPHFPSSWAAKLKNDKRLGGRGKRVEEEAIKRNYRGKSKEEKTRLVRRYTQ